MEWKPGDIAICINNGRFAYTGPGTIPSLRLDAQYIVNKVRTCECGCTTLDVGLNSPNSERGINCDCGAISAPTGIHWAASERFVKPKTDEATAEAEEDIEKQIELAIEAEDYESVDKLLDKLNK